MSRIRKVCLPLLLTLWLTTGYSALAVTSSVTYEGGAEEFVFLPGNEYSDTSLYPDFLNLLPGDVIEQKITVKNASDKGVRIYMRAEPVSDAERDFLNQLYMIVRSASDEIFDAQVGRQSELASYALLGTLRDGGSTELTITLTVPTDLGNEYIEKRGAVPWTFVAEEVGEAGSAPETGDRYDVSAWLGTAGVAAAVLLALAQKRRRRRSLEAD